MNVTIQYTRGKEVITEPLENITRRGLKLKIARMKKKGFTYVILKCTL
jgi:HKD family nuclease